MIACKYPAKILARKVQDIGSLIIRSITILSLGISASLANGENLEDAWQQALSGNFKIKAAEQQQLAADAQLASANSERLPSVVLAADYLRLDNAPTFEGAFGPSTSFVVPYLDQESMYYSASTILPIYTGGRISADINAAKAQRSAAEANTSHSVSSVKIAVANAYINVLRSQSAGALAKSHVTSLIGHQADVANMLEQGLVSRTNLLTANVALADARQRLLQANHKVELARADYNRLLNRPLGTEFLLNSVAASALTQSLDELSSEALVKRADLQTLKHRSRVLEENAKVATSASRPQLGLSGTYLHHNNKINSYEDIVAANVNMVWYVFDGGVSRHRSNQLLRQAAAVRAQQDELAGVINLQVRQAWLAFEAAQQRIKIASGSIEQAEENLTSSKNRFQAGLIVNTEVLDAENLRVQAHDNHSNAVFDATFAILQLKHVVGIL
jgi:outer membrane protein TolC